ncbi:hypothetical protein FBZ87_107177 [Nitrospirillum amazonense]|uniref:DUF4435 domain-containing protein n=2 Tax=Nitrospirillum amazonense TaxID=28077 RepID=A0A560JHW7_9PROT|nr:hypothetical protein FBZ87_107177 [Nitrospirillum amazonense]
MVRFCENIGEEYRFTVSRIIATYSLEQDLRDIFVEGKSDVCVLQEYARVNSINNSKIYNIDDVFIPNNMLKPPHGSGNRGRVIALAETLSEHPDLGYDNVFCLADKDLDQLEDIPPYRRLWLTEFTCLEAYIFTNEITMQIINTFFCKKIDHDNVREIMRTCVYLYFARKYKKDKAPSLSWVDPSNSISMEGASLIFDSSNFLERMLTNQGMAHLTEDAKETIARMTDSHNTDARYAIHKDDYFRVICRYAKLKRCDANLCKPEVFSRVALSHILNGSSKYSTFQKYLEWAKPSQGARP